MESKIIGFSFLSIWDSVMNLILFVIIALIVILLIDLIKMIKDERL